MEAAKRQLEDIFSLFAEEEVVAEDEESDTESDSEDDEDRGDAAGGGEGGRGVESRADEGGSAGDKKR